jgi:PTS system nitrogen regulatory IIA component
MDLTIREVAAIFDVTERRIYRWIHEEDLPAREVNGRQCFNRTELLEWATVRRVIFSPALIRDPSAGPAVGEELADALRAGGIMTDIHGADKPGVLREIVDRLRLPDGFRRSALLQLFLSRESIGSTAVGDGIAIPHPRYPVVLAIGRPLLTLCFLDQPIEFGALDGRPVHTLFVLVSPTIRSHLRMLARIACALRDERFRAVLLLRSSTEVILREVQRLEGCFGRSSVDTPEST